MKQPEEITINTLNFDDDGQIPNNPYLPVLVYQNVFLATDDLRHILSTNQWGNTWEGGVFSYHHYHSNSHEVLLVINGTAQLILGGKNGTLINITEGDALILPAGTGHKLVSQSNDFAVMGAYPHSQSYDICVGKVSERPQNLYNIENVSIPNTDPIFGSHGPLKKRWN
ncbi:cupin domain-containing protein [Staphylococcus sp. KG4-3]|uniref:Cupin domain-containing protein n=3 Tax=Staphylococcus xylosus TaxID=1288 RepID=A0A418ISM1_STAXY|nr:MULTISPECIES: cupin domain-containing protein [Staphylococcus]MDW8543150.1 cupin domain-containing protein [Staphylococcus sp. KG4-1]MDW8562568.1 cupin domain-containing protein [Staphylococcus sp. KG4-3]PTI09585.1 hypothetical protein BU096_03870 [Staphylococcus xylosus]RIN13085.1 cupin domain-containing protein [Staphylococcus xylosus]